MPGWSAKGLGMKVARQPCSTAVFLTMYFISMIASALLLMSNIAAAQEPAESAPTGQMMGEDMMGQKGQCKKMDRGMRHGAMGHGMPMRLIFILMDTDGDGTLSLEEFQTAHAKIFKGLDADKDGKQMFFGGSAPSAEPPR